MVRPGAYLDPHTAKQIEKQARGKLTTNINIQSDTKETHTRQEKYTVYGKRRTQRKTNIKNNNNTKSMIDSNFGFLILPIVCQLPAACTQ